MPDLAAVRAGLRERGVVFVRYPHMGQDEHGVWTGVPHLAIKLPLSTGAERTP